MTDAADFFVGGDFHGAFGHLRGSPELILIAVRVGQVNGGAFVPFGGCLHRVGVWNLVAIEPAQVHGDIFRMDVKAATRQLLAKFFCRRIDLGLKKPADAARSALPPEEQIIFTFFFRAAVVSPLIGLRVSPMPFTAQSVQATISLVPTTKWSIQ